MADEFSRHLNFLLRTPISRGMPHSATLLKGPVSAEAPDERARMGRISGWLWMISAVVGVGAAFLPGAVHEGIGWVLGLGAFTFLYGLGSVTGAIPWERASFNALAVGMVLTIPVVGLAIFITGGALSYIEPLLVCPLLYAAFFFPSRWAWPLSIELILIAGTPLLYDSSAIDDAYLSRYLALAVGYLAATWVMVGLKHRLVAAEERQRDAANRDSLTGVGNRRYFDAALNREIDSRTRPRRGRRDGDLGPFALLLIDLDDFKGVNDEHGHITGDSVLVKAAARAFRVLRSTDTMARIGGDEFAVIAPGAQGEGAQRMAESISLAVSAPDPSAAEPVPSASIGWAVFPDDGADYETLMHRADERMMARKHRSERAPVRGGFPV
jgi:diguanylate cyclase (GGDEF)-like protein